MNKFFAQTVTLATLVAALMCARAQDTNPPAVPPPSTPLPMPLNTDLGTPTNLPAATAETPAPAAAPAKAKPTKPKARKPAGTPFRGQLEAVDRVGMTFTISSKAGKRRTFEITSQTRFTKDGKPAIFSDGVIGDEVAGYAKKAKNDKFEAVSVRFGPKPTPNEKPAKAKKSHSAKTEETPKAE